MTTTERPPASLRAHRGVRLAVLAALLVTQGLLAHDSLRRGAPNPATVEEILLRQAGCAVLLLSLIHI